MSAPAPKTLPSRLNPARLLGAVAFTALGFVAVWQGFGLAGYGTDAHAPRVLGALAPLFVCGLVLVWPRWSPLRGGAALVGLAGASAAWWLVPVSPGPKVSLSLQDAAEKRDWYKANLTKATVEELEPSKGHPELKLLRTHYPSLTHDLQADYDRWATTVADEIIARYRAAPLDDFKGIEALNEPAAILSKAHQASADRLDVAKRQWHSNVLHAKMHELLKLAPGDWTGFNNTANGRFTVADALPDTRNTLVRAEADWVDASVESIVANKFVPKAGEPAPKRAFWKQTHWDVLALKSLDTEENRFAKARGRLFKVAHETAGRDALAHFEANEYALAFGVARAHSVDWSATATVLGEREEKSLAALRGAYAGLAALAAKSTPPEIAPPPRTKP